MKIGIFGDVHGNYVALKSVIDDMKANGINLYIVLGDIIFSGEESQKCFDTIQDLEPLVWIKGNTDDWFAHTHSPYVVSFNGKLIMKCWIAQR